MRYLAAYMLCQLGGKDKPSAADIKSILSSVGIEHEDDRLDSLLKELSGKDTAQLIDEGRSKMASVPMGGGAGVAAAATGAAASAPAAAEAPAAGKAPAKEEKKEESEESDADLGFGLFD